MKRLVSHSFAAALLWACLLAPLGAAAQTTTGTIRGYVRGAEGAELAGATVTARSLETNQQRQAVTSAQGFYVLPGLRPGPYELSVRMLGFAEQRRPLQLQVGQSIDVNFDLTGQALVLEAVTVAAPAAETRTSEVATNVTRQQVENLPTADRNFLSLATLAPGTQLQADVLDGQRKTFTAGAQGAEQVNVFIDGASYKNDILQGGVAGQDASRGNPFPRNAIREFRIITQNFKAEYQKASSAIITATTRSGTNSWETSGFVNYQDREFIGLNSFQEREARGNLTYTRPRFDRLQFGADVGGPIIRDRLHFFASVERNDQTRVRRVNIVPPSGFPALDSINFAALNGEFDEPFEATLLFGKLSFEHTPRSFVELSYHLRDETDVRDFGNYTAYTAGTNFHNDVNTGVLKHTWTPGDFLNEATASFQRYQYNPEPIRSDLANRFFGFGCDQGCAQIGGNRSDQDFTQDRLSLRNDLTWSGLRVGGEHLVKGG
ncbi:MAG TPA: carboxypeptidase-like regulatory domain-containing protein, partial [Longimicrobium sp.]|nr:carboxypeptidase-like regulatory domain-containing protein [Longimicrobium sp.]